MFVGVIDHVRDTQETLRYQDTRRYQDRLTPHQDSVNRLHLNQYFMRKENSYNVENKQRKIDAN